MSALDLWLVEGARAHVRAQPETPPRAIFHRIRGERGPWTTFLHGFPTSSFDWAKVSHLLPPGRRRLYIDHLGFGHSDKPAPHGYSFDEQIGFVQAIWAKHSIQRTVLVAHDYSVSMAQEILARCNAGTWKGPEIAGLVLLNGGLFFSRQNPLLIQRLLRNRLTGPVVSRLVTERTFNRNMKRIAHPAHPWSDDELHDHWRGVEAHHGRRVYHLVSRYHEERARNEARWEKALAETKIPVALAWGDADPISGQAMSAHVRATMPHIHVESWDDVGHYPQSEVPERVAAQVVRMETVDAVGRNGH